MTDESICLTDMISEVDRRCWEPTNKSL